MTTATAAPTRCESCGREAEINVTLTQHDACLECEHRIVAVDLQDAATATGIIEHLIEEGRIAPADVVEVGRTSSGPAMPRAELREIYDEILAKQCRPRSQEAAA